MLGEAASQVRSSAILGSSQPVVATIVEICCDTRNSTIEGLASGTVASMTTSGRRSTTADSGSLEPSLPTSSTAGLSSKRVQIELPSRPCAPITTQRTGCCGGRSVILVDVTAPSLPSPAPGHIRVAGEPSLLGC